MWYSGTIHWVPFRWHFVHADECSLRWHFILLLLQFKHAACFVMPPLFELDGDSELPAMVWSKSPQELSLASVPRTQQGHRHRFGSSHRHKFDFLMNPGYVTVELYQKLIAGEFDEL